jgi:putative chitinase
MTFNRETFFKEYRRHFGPLDTEQVEGLNALLDSIEGDEEVTDLRWAAYMLATVKHECADTYQPIIERGGRAYFNKYEPATRIGKSLGNTVKGDGFLYRGRGYVQLTGKANYRKMTTALELSSEDDLVAHPDRALDPSIAYQIMSYGMRHGSFTGKKISTYINESKADYVNARRVINGTDRADLIAGYARQFESIMRAAGETGDEPSPPALAEDESRPAPTLEQAPTPAPESSGPTMTGEPAVQVNQMAEAPPPLISKPTDSSIQVLTSSAKAMYEAVTTKLGIGVSVIVAFFVNNPWAIALVVAAIIAFAVIEYARQKRHTELDKLQMDIASRPDRYTVQRQNE